MVRSRNYSLMGIASVKNPIIDLVGRLLLEEVYYSLSSNCLLVF